MSAAPAPAILEALYRVVRDMRAQYDHNALEVGLTLARARVLMALLRKDGVTQAKLAHDIGIEAPTLKRHLDGLETEGYLERRALEGDTRKRALFLTERAHNAETLRFVQRLRSDLLIGISEEEQAVVCNVLERIQRNAANLAQS